MEILEYVIISDHTVNRRAFLTLIYIGGVAA